MVAFFVSSMVIVVLLSFGRTTNDGFPVFALRTDNYRALWNEVYFELFMRSLVYALATVVISLLIAYPVAYAIALYGGRYKNALIAAIVVPFFASYLIRMYAWKALLSDDGLLNSGLRELGLSDGITFLNTPYAVVGGLVYGFVVFMILPIYASLERLDVSLIEAGKDLYHGPVRTFFFVTCRPREPVCTAACCWSSCRRSATSSGAAAGRREHLHDGQPGPAAVHGGPELAAGLGADRRHDGGADHPHGRLPPRHVDQGT